MDTLRQQCLLEIEGTSGTGEIISQFDERLHLNLSSSSTSDLSLGDISNDDMKSEYPLDMAVYLNDSKQRLRGMHCTDERMTSGDFRHFTLNKEEIEMDDVNEYMDYRYANTNVDIQANHKGNYLPQSKNFHGLANNTSKSDIGKHISRKLRHISCSVGSSKKSLGRKASCLLQDVKESGFYDENATVIWDTHSNKQNNGSKRRRRLQDYKRDKPAAVERNKSNARCSIIAGDKSQKNIHHSTTENIVQKKQRSAYYVSQKSHSSNRKENRKKDTEHLPVIVDGPSRFLHVPTATMLRAKQRAVPKPVHETCLEVDSQETILKCYPEQRNPSKTRALINKQNRDETTMLLRNVDVKRNKEDPEKDMFKKARITEHGKTARNCIPMNSLLRAEARSRRSESRQKETGNGGIATEKVRTKESSEENSGILKTFSERNRAEKSRTKGSTENNDPINTLIRVEIKWRGKEEKTENFDKESKRKREGVVLSAVDNSSKSKKMNTNNSGGRSLRSTSQVSRAERTARAASTAEATAKPSASRSSRHRSRCAGPAVALLSGETDVSTAASAGYQTEGITVSGIHVSSRGSSRSSSLCSEPAVTTMSAQAEALVAAALASPAAAKAFSRGSSRGGLLHRGSSDVAIKTVADVVASTHSVGEATNLRLSSRCSARRNTVRKAMATVKGDDAAAAETDVSLCSRGSSRRIEAAVVAVAPDIKGVSSLLDRRAAGDIGGNAAQTPRSRILTKRTQDTKTTTKENLPEINLPKKTSKLYDATKAVRKTTTVILPPIKKTKTPRESTSTLGGVSGCARKPPAVDTKKQIPFR